MIAINISKCSTIMNFNRFLLHNSLLQLYRRGIILTRLPTKPSYSCRDISSYKISRSGINCNKLHQLNTSNIKFGPLSLSILANNYQIFNTSRYFSNNQIDDPHISSSAASTNNRLHPEGFLEAEIANGQSRSTRSRLAALFAALGLSTLTIVLSFGIFFYYNVLCCHKKIKLPILLQLNRLSITSYEDLIGQVIRNHNNGSLLNINLLENLIDYYLLESLSNNNYIQSNFKLPIMLENFQFKKNDFNVTYNSKNLKVKIMELAPPDSVSPSSNIARKEEQKYPSPWLLFHIKVLQYSKDFNVTKYSKALRNLNPFSREVSGDRIGKRAGELEDNVKLYNEDNNNNNNRKKSGGGDENDLIISGKLSILNNLEPHQSVEGGIKGGMIGTNNDEKYSLEFEGLFNDEHRHYIKIFSCNLLKDDRFVKKLW